MADSKKYDGSQWEHSLRKLTTATEAVENPLYSDGTAITAYTIKGNTVQNGTPTPDNPVDANGVGVRTGNLWDGTYKINWGVEVSNKRVYITSNRVALIIQVDSNTDYTISRSEVGGSTYFVYGLSSELPNDHTVFEYCDRFDYDALSQTVNSQECNYLTIFFGVALSPNIMVNTGSTDLPYEPFGYKIPISSAGQTIDIYIGDLPLLKSLDGIAVDEIGNGTLTRRVDSDGSVLPAPITTRITMPSIPTTEGANSITVDTTVQPSEFTATWTGWHNSSVKEWDGSDWQ